VPLILFPGVLLLVFGKPTADAKGKAIPHTICIKSSVESSFSLQSFVTLYEKLNEVYNECEGDEDMISPAQACLMFVDWTDPQKAVYVVITSQELCSLLLLLP
jgi:hypothetical protein